MAVYNTNTTSPSPPVYRHESWSMATIHFKDPVLKPITINVKASPGIGKHVSQEMRDTGFCYLFTDTQSILIAASEIHSIEFTKLTTEEAP